MKTSIIFFCLFFLVFSSTAQEVTPIYGPTAALNLIPTSKSNTFIYEIKESYSGEFIEEPEDFLQKNIDIHALINTLSEKNFDKYWISIICKKGALNAKFSKEGKLRRIRQKYKNIKVPYEIMWELYDKYTGWTMVKNKYVSFKNSNGINREIYHIKLKKGKESKKIKIYPDSNQRKGVVGTSLP